MSPINEDPNPTPPPSGNDPGQADPNAGQDLSYLDPELAASQSEPSFNQDPPGANGSGGSGASMAADPGLIKVDLASLRSVELNLLSGTQEAVSMYNSLRQAVVSAASQPYFWGPTPPTAAQMMPTGGKAGQELGQPPADAEEQLQLSQAAQTFGESMDPVMEKALYQVSSALEVLGVFIAAVNTTGQSYGEVDRASLFPATPGVASAVSTATAASVVAGASGAAAAAGGSGATS